MPNLRFNDGNAQNWVANGDLVFPLAESDLIRGALVFVRGTITGGAAVVLQNHFPRGLLRRISFRTDADNVKLMDALPCSFFGDYVGHRFWLRGREVNSIEVGEPPVIDSVLIEVCYHVRHNPDEMQASMTQRRFEFMSQNRRNVRVEVRCGNLADLGADVTFTGAVSVVRDADVIKPSLYEQIIKNLAYRHEDTIEFPILVGNNRIPLSRDGFLRTLITVATQDRADIAFPAGANIGNLNEAAITDIALNVPRGSRPISLRYNDFCGCYRTNAVDYTNYNRINQEGVGIMPFDEDAAGGSYEMIDLYQNQCTLEVNAAAPCTLFVHQEILRKPEIKG